MSMEFSAVSPFPMTDSREAGTVDGRALRIGEVSEVILRDSHSGCDVILHDGTALTADTGDILPLLDAMGFGEGFIDDDENRTALPTTAVIFQEPAPDARVRAVLAQGFALEPGEVLTLPLLLPSALLDSACLSRRHDYGLLPRVEQEALRLEAARWWRCFARAINSWQVSP